MQTKTLLGIVSLMILSSFGCQHTVLQEKTENQTSALPELYYEQVLDNIAMFSTNPDSLPFFGYASAGTTQVQRTGQLSAQITNTANLTNFYLSALGFTPQVSQTSQEAWTTSPSQEPNELFMIRCVYQRVVGSCSNECETALHRFFDEKHYGWPSFQPGWYCVGRKCDVPKNALYVGHHKEVYAWVPPQNIDQLTRLTLSILDIATADVGELTKRESDTTSKPATIARLQERIRYIAEVLKNIPDTSKEPYASLKKAMDADIEIYLKLIPPITLNDEGQLLDSKGTVITPEKSTLPSRQRKSLNPFAPPLQPLIQ